MLHEDNLAPLSRSQVALAVCLTYVPTVIHVVWQSCAMHLFKHRLSRDPEFDAGGHHWNLMQSFGDV